MIRRFQNHAFAPNFTSCWQKRSILANTLTVGELGDVEIHLWQESQSASVSNFRDLVPWAISVIAVIQDTPRIPSLPGGNPSNFVPGAPSRKSSGRLVMAPDLSRFLAAQPMCAEHPGSEALPPQHRNRSSTSRSRSCRSPYEGQELFTFFGCCCPCLPAGWRRTCRVHAHLLTRKLPEPTQNKRGSQLLYIRWVISAALGVRSLRVHLPNASTFGLGSNIQVEKPRGVRQIAQALIRNSGETCMVQLPK